MINFIFKIFFAVFFLISCSNKNIINQKSTPYNMFYKSQKYLKLGKFEKAIEKLEEIYNNYPLSPYFTQVNLDLIYAYYKNLDFELAKKKINEFMIHYPKHPNMDYVLYMNGLINMSREDRTTQKIFGNDFPNKSIASLMFAFDSFCKINLYYKDSKYFDDSYHRLLYLKKFLSEQNFLKAKFYYKNKSYISVIHSIKEILKYFPDTKSAFLSLLIMQDSYLKLNLQEEANKIKKLLILIQDKSIY